MSPDSNPSLSTVEPVSVSAPDSCREKVWRGQRRGRDYCRRLPIPSQSHGKLKTIPPAAGSRIRAGLRGGAGRTQTDNQPIMSLRVIVSTAAVGRLLRELTGRTAVPSIGHRLRKRRHGSVVPTGPVNDRGQCTWLDERERRQEANVPFYLAFTLRDLGERSNAARCEIVDPGARLGYGEENSVPELDGRVRNRTGLEARPFRDRHSK
jgi:hypothetical protein